jgi:hypothetical protein
MRSPILRLVLAAMCIGMCSAHADDATKSTNSAAEKSPAASQPSSPPAASTPQPAPQMLSLAKAIVGKWSISETFEPSEGDSKGGVGYGEEVWRSGPGGFTLMEEERNHTPRGEVFLIALHWWDREKGAFRGLLCTSGDPQGCDLETATGAAIQWDGRKLVIDMAFSQKNGKKRFWHEVFTDFTANSFTQTGDIGEAGEPPKRWITIHATRVATGN